MEKKNANIVNKVIGTILMKIKIKIGFTNENLRVLNPFTIDTKGKFINIFFKNFIINLF